MSKELYRFGFAIGSKMSVSEKRNFGLIITRPTIFGNEEFFKNAIMKHAIGLQVEVPKEFLTEEFNTLKVDIVSGINNSHIYKSDIQL